MRRDHHALVGDARALLESSGTRQGLAGQHVALPIRGDAAQLGTKMVVAVNAQRELGRVLAEDLDGAPVGKPRVEGAHRDCHMVAVLLGVTGEIGIAKVPVSGPVQVGIVQDEGRLQAGRLGRRLGRETVQEVGEGEQGQAASRSQALAQ